MGNKEELDPHIDGVVPQPVTYEENLFLGGLLAGNLRRIYAAFDEEGNDLSALPAKAADEIERLQRRVTDMNEALQRVKGRVCGEADVCDMALLTTTDSSPTEAS